MSYFLFIVYFIIICWFITRIRFFRASGLDNKILLILFTIKVIAGIINGWINSHYYTGTDNWAFHNEGIDEYHLLFSQPKEYFLNLFTSYHNHSYGRLMDTTDSFWNDLRTNMIAKLLSIFDIISNCNFYINTLFYNFLVFFGVVSLYRVFKEIFPFTKNAVIISVFLLPSFIYFTSGIHRDGLILLGIGIVCFNMFRIVRHQEITFKKILYTVLGLLLVFLLRNFVFITLCPALIAWVVAEKSNRNVLLRFCVVYTIFALLFFSIKYMHPKLNLPEYVSERQLEFIKLSENSPSGININPLFPNFRSFLNNTPQALNHSLMRPYITEKSSWVYFISAAEILAYEILFLLFLLQYKKNQSNDPFIYFGLFFTLSMFLIIGYTIPIIGAIVRYRSIYLPFLIAPLLCQVNFKKIIF
ncbi:MAG: hypothetical protein H0W12_08020 [Chitinophagaceae bacterium]|nr:hypothetical protein [Chitinophagaceae bacterium]